MNPSDQYPLDWTGYGPTGTGGAPNAREMRTTAMNQFRTTQMAMAMQYIDPTAIAAASKMMQVVTKQSASPAELRRALFGSSVGQGALDTAMLMRRAGLLGAGDPINYASNISQAVAVGGFGTTVGGAANGSRVAGYGPVSGQGPIAARVAANFAKGIIQDVYGGSSDTSRASGYNMEEVSQVFGVLARRGVIGNVASIQKGADINTRIAAGRKEELDPNIKAFLGGINLTGDTEGERLKSLDKIIEATTDQKQRRAIEKIKSHPDAVIINENERQRLSKITKEVVAGMATISDIYSDLDAAGQMMKLESISGRRITGRGDARQSAALANQLRESAQAAGMDPRAFMDWSADAQLQLNADLARAFGMDARHSALAKSASAPLQARLARDSAVGGMTGARAAERARALGIDAADAMDMTELYEDKQQGHMDFVNRYQGMTMLMGGTGNLTGADREEAEMLKKKFMATSDANERAAIDGQIRALLARALSGVGDFDAFKTGRTAQNMKAKSTSNPVALSAMMRAVEDGRLQDTDYRAVEGQLSDMGIGDAATVSGMLKRDVGAGGMAELLRISQLGGSAEDRRKMQTDLLGEGGVKGEAADQFLKLFFDGQSRAKDSAKYSNMTSLMTQADYGDYSTLGRSVQLKERLAQIGSQSLRVKMNAGDAGLDFATIGTAWATGSLNKNNINDGNTMIEVLEMMKKSGRMPGVVGKDGKVVDASTQYVDKLDFSAGLNQPGLEKLSSLLGKPLDLHKKMGYDTERDLIEASQKDGNVLELASNLLRTDKDYAGISVGGSLKNTTAITETALDHFQTNGVLKDASAQAGGAAILGRLLNLPEGQGANIGMLADSTYNDGKLGFAGRLGNSMSRLGAMGMGGLAGFGVLSGIWGDPVEDGPAGIQGDGINQLHKLTTFIGGANENDMEALGTMDKHGEMRRKIKGGIALLDAATANKQSTVQLDVNGKPAEVIVTELRTQFEAAIAKLDRRQQADEGGSSVSSINVTGDIIVTGQVRPKVPD